MDVQRSVDRRYLRFFLEISDGLKWLQDRVAPVTFMGLALANMLWLDFLMTFHLPVNYFSSSLVAVLPALIISATFVLLVLTVSALLPAAVLCMPVEADGSPLVKFPGTARKIKGVPAKPDAWNRWLLTAILTGVLWLVALALIAPDTDLLVWDFLGIQCVSFLLGLLLFWPCIRATGASRPSWAFIATLFGCTLLQNAVVLEMMSAILWFMRTTDWMTLLAGVVVFLVALATVGGCQLFIAHYIINAKTHRHVLIHTVLMVTGLLVAITLIPPVGGVLASFPFRLSGSGLHSCSVLTLSQSPTEQSIPPALRDPSHPGQTVPLNFVVQMDGIYYVKMQPFADAVYRFPSSRVTATTSCPTSKP